MEKYTITIEYCVPWNYWPRAARLADEILKNYQHVVENLNLVTGSGGAYEITVNDELIYSKHETGRHADEGEVFAIFQKMVGPDVPIYGT